MMGELYKHFAEVRLITEIMLVGQRSKAVNCR